jgi:hypothetical protein
MGGVYYLSFELTGTTKLSSLPIQWMGFMYSIRSLLLLCVFTGPASAGVVINEIMYHAPEDLDGVQFIELHNANDSAIDLSGWRITKGLRHDFPFGTSIPADGYLVICKDAVAQKYFDFDQPGLCGS